MRLTFPFASLLALAASIGCASTGTSGGETATDATITTPRLAGVLQSGGSGLAGEINIAPTSRAGEFRATLAVRGGSAGQLLPWHVHRGNCNANVVGTVVGSLVSYQPLQPRGDGTADLTQTVRASLEPGQAYYVDIHASRSDMERIVGCADLHPTAP